MPTLELGLDGCSPVARPGTVTLADSELLDARLHRRVLSVDAVPRFEPISVPDGATTLADISGQPLWIRADDGRGERHLVAAALPELQRGESLRDLLSPGRIPALLPVVHFLREITGYSEVEHPPLRACFVIDDPNLHSARYGFLDYRRLVEHAKQHDYHAAMATVPLDGWFARDPTVRLFRGATSHLSLLMHGNNHTRSELRSTRDLLFPMLAQALARTDAMERRLGLDVGRIMVPPHEVWSNDVPEVLAALGYEALCADYRPQEFDDDALRGWRSADLTRAGLPILGRRLFVQPHLEQILLLSAYLDQPMIAYGHHGDVRDGLEILARTAEIVRSSGETAWMSPTAISRSNYTVHRGAVATVTLYSSRVTIAPHGAEVIFVRIPADLGRSEADTLVVGGATVPLHRSGSELISEPVRVAGQTLDVTIRRESHVELRAIPKPQSAFRPVVRRVLTEARDRFEPLVWRASTRLRTKDVREGERA